MTEYIFAFIVSSCECSLGSRAASDTRGLRALRMPKTKQLARRPPKPAVLW